MIDLLPSNLEAEQKLLGAIVMQNMFLFDCIDILTPDHFSEEIHSRIYEKMIELSDSGRKYDILGLGQHFENETVEASIKGSEYIYNLADNAFNVNVRDAAKTIVDCYKRRGVIVNCESAINRARTSINDSELITDIQNDLENIIIAEDGETVINAKTITDSILEKAQNPNRDYGVPTGLKAIDDVIGGCPKSDVTIIGGRSSMGKTALAIAMFKNQVPAGYNGIFFSLEMSTEQLTNRLLCNISYKKDQGDMNWNYSNLMKWGLKDRQFKMLQAATSVMQGSDYLIDDRSGLTVAQIAATVRKKET